MSCAGCQSTRNHLLSSAADTCNFQQEVLVACSSRGIEDGTDCRIVLVLRLRRAERSGTAVRPPTLSAAKLCNVSHEIYLLMQGLAAAAATREAAKRKGHSAEDKVFSSGTAAAKSLECIICFCCLRQSS